MVKSIEDEIQDLFEEWMPKKICDFMKDILHIFELYDLPDDEDWIAKEVGPENERNVRVIRTFYLLSKFAEKHAASLVRLNVKNSNLYNRLEKVRNSIKSNS